MKVNSKIKNYEHNLVQYQNKSMLYGGSYKGNIKRKNCAAIYDLLFLNLIASDNRVKEIIYFKDYTEKKNNYNGDGYLESIEEIQNTLNMMGADALVQTHKSIYVDFKVLKYYEKYNKRNQIYNGELNEIYGMDNLVIQYSNSIPVERNPYKLGWGNNITKITQYMLIYVPEIQFLYVLDYKKLTRFVNDALKYDEYEKIRFDKMKKVNGYIHYYDEKCISVPVKDLVENNVIFRFFKVNSDIKDNSLYNKNNS